MITATAFLNQPQQQSLRELGKVAPLQPRVQCPPTLWSQQTAVYYVPISIRNTISKYYIIILRVAEAKQVQQVFH